MPQSVARQPAVVVDAPEADEHTAGAVVLVIQGRGWDGLRAVREPVFRGPPRKGGRVQTLGQRAVAIGRHGGELRRTAVQLHPEVAVDVEQHFDAIARSRGPLQSAARGEADDRDRPFDRVTLGFQRCDRVAQRGARTQRVVDDHDRLAPVTGTLDAASGQVGLALLADRQAGVPAGARRDARRQQRQRGHPVRGELGRLEINEPIQQRARREVQTGAGHRDVPRVEHPWRSGTVTMTNGMLRCRPQHSVGGEQGAQPLQSLLVAHRNRQPAPAMLSSFASMPLSRAVSSCSTFASRSVSWAKMS